MMSTTFLSRFTPSIMAPRILEAIFVQRKPLAERLVELIKDSALTRSKHHTLLIGPRGIGKTHLVSLVYHRVRQADVVKEGRLLIAWLREEEWGVMSFLDLLLRIHRALVAEYKDQELESRVEALFEMSADEAERAASALLKDYVGGRTLLIIIENLDDLFGGLDDEGQKRLRSYLQENPFSTILATSQSLFRGVSLQTSPFYGFFRITHLEELSIEEATQLLSNIAELDGDKDLAALIGTSLGRVRIRALHRLAGGNPRVYIIFSQFLTRESLNELIDALMRTLDELTPYYHERIRWLSQQQRKIVELLCDRGSAHSVKEIASRSFMSHQTASGQLKLLRGMGYVQATPLGRESYYELREPLMRLCVEVKKHRDRPIRLVVELLRSWYTTEELQKRLSKLPPDVGGPLSEREHIHAALTEYQSAEVLVSLSNTERINQAALGLVRGVEIEREVNARIISEAVGKMARLMARRHHLEQSGHTMEDLAQTALLKFLTRADSAPESLYEVNDFAAYLYRIVRDTAIVIERKEARRQGREHIPELTEFQRRIDFLVERTPPSPDEVLEMRVLLLNRTLSYLLTAGDKDNLIERLTELAREMSGSGAEDVLSESLIRSFILLYKEEDPDTEQLNLEEWYNISKEILESYLEYELTLRILEKIVRYSKTKDKRILLELPLEERTFMEPLLDD
jgi:DNA-directed RNA polymerase specialized sigma24 family protein/DNA-binding transcriptional ArsR family regulator